MEGCPRKGTEVSPRLLDLIPKSREWLVQGDDQKSHRSSEDKKLELRLGPPGEDWPAKDTTMTRSRERDESPLSLGCFSAMASMAHKANHGHPTNTSSNTISGVKRGLMGAAERETMEKHWIMTNNISGGQNHKFPSSEIPAWSSSSYQGNTKVPYTKLPSTPQSLPVMAVESSQPCGTKGVGLQDAEKKAFSPPSAAAAATNSSQKRSPPASVVGWPPVRSFRRNLASSSSSKLREAPNVVADKVASEKPVENCPKGLFVKINMDGVPIGRKVDLKAHDSYEKLSSAVDKLFRGLLAAQGDNCGGCQSKETEKEITGLLDGNGEYTLVYEDNEGDRMLVGDVPWHLFASTVKRLRVLKSSELSALRIGSKQENIKPDAVH